MARLGSFDVAGRVDNTSMLVGTEIHKKVASAKNYKINAVRRFMLEGLAPETGGLLKYHEIGYDGDAYSTPYDFVNDIEEDIDILRYHILVVRINEDKFLFTRQGVSIGTNSEAVEEEDFIALNGISAGTIRQLVLDLESRTNFTISELETAINLAINELEASTNAQLANLNNILDEVSLNHSDSILSERNSRIAAVNVLSEAITTETQVRAALTTSLSVSIADEISNRTASVITLNEALADESTARATLASTLTAAIEDEASAREAVVATLNESIVDEFTARAALGTTLTAAIGTETANRQAAVNTLQTAIATESTARAELGTSLNAAITTETTNRQSAVTTLQQADTTEAQTRAALGIALTAAINTETTNRQAAVITLQQADTTEAATRAALGTTLTAAINTEKTNREAAVTLLTTAIADEVSTRVTLGTTLTAAVNTEKTSREASVGVLTTAIADEKTARVTDINSLTATVDGHTTSITTTSTAIAGINGKLDASYGLSVDAGGRIASMKLLSNGTTSQIAFTADTFKIFNGSSNIAPFTVSNNQVKMTNVAVESLITPGSSGLSLNVNNDNLLQFRHPNGVVGMKMGIVDGVLALNWYDAAGTLIWQGGTGGVVAVESSAAAYAGQITNIGAITITGIIGSGLTLTSSGTFLEGATVEASSPAANRIKIKFRQPHLDLKFKANICRIRSSVITDYTSFTRVGADEFEFTFSGALQVNDIYRYEIVKTLF